MALTFEEIRSNPSIQTYITKADEALSALGYTEHSFPHVLRVCHDATYIMDTLGYNKHEIELDNKLPAFLDERYTEEERKQISTLLRHMRNKIAHKECFWRNRICFYKSFSKANAHRFNW